MISVRNITVEFNATKLLDDISYTINRRDRIALVGKNGAGKSTMLKIIAGLQNPTSGAVAVPNDTTIGYLPQQMEVADSTTLADEVRKAFGHIADMHRRLDDMNARLSERTDYESEAYAKLIDEVTTLSERIAMEESENHEAEMERTLTGLGFLRTDFDRPTAEFSGGWRMRIELAKLLLRHPDVLLLDEPTNHLDIESIQWLENFLMTKAQAVVLVSHDRAFIDNVTNRTIEISLGHIYDYAVNYSKFLELRKERLEQQQRAYANQQKMIQVFPAGVIFGLADIRPVLGRYDVQQNIVPSVGGEIERDKIVDFVFGKSDVNCLFDFSIGENADFCVVVRFLHR